ncbi:dUTPase-like protein [Cryomyces antarcticus]
MAATSSPAVVHDPPSLPPSPSPKRTKMIEPSSTLSVAAILNEDVVPTPTPLSPRQSLNGFAPDSGASATDLDDPITAMSTEAPPPPLQVKLLSDRGRVPTRGSPFAAGYDVYSAHDTTVTARGKALVNTDIAIAVPAGTYGRIAPRSGLASKHSIDVGAGVIDCDYRGPVKVLLFNFSDTDFDVKAGERIAQLIIERIYTPEIVVVEALAESVRGAGGFGSTGGFAGVTVTNGN